MKTTPARLGSRGERVAALCLLLGLLLVLCGLCRSPAPSERAPSGVARVARLLPHAALLTFDDGAFRVVPRHLLAPPVRPGDLLDVNLRPLPARRLVSREAGGWPDQRSW